MTPEYLERIATALERIAVALENKPVLNDTDSTDDAILVMTQQGEAVGFRPPTLPKSR